MKNILSHALITVSVILPCLGFMNSYASSTLVTDAVGTKELYTFEDNVVNLVRFKKLISKVNQTDGKGITQTFDINNNILTRTDAEGRTTAYTYNATNQRISMIEAVGTLQERTTVYEYISPDIDLVTRTIQPSVLSGNFKETLNVYDVNLNIISTTINGFKLNGESVSKSTAFQYNSNGQVIQIDGPRLDVNDVTTFTYYECDNGGECGQLKSVTNALGHTTSYDSYDSNGRLVQMTNAKLNPIVTKYTYHPRGWLLSKTEGSVESRITSYEYDGVGQMVRSTFPDGITLDYEYDAAHDLRAITDNMGNKIAYEYDEKGNQTKQRILNSDGSLASLVFTVYDVRNFVDSIDAAGSVTQMVNDAVGNVRSQTDPNNSPSTHYYYDALDRLQSTVDALSNVSNYRYNVANQLLEAQTPNGSTTIYEYDDLGNLLKEASSDRGDTLYTHDAAGNVLSMTDARGITVTYQYDALNRVLSAKYPDNNEDISYTYDVGRNGVGLLKLVEDETGLTEYNYDIWGNVLLVQKHERNVSGDDIGFYQTYYTYDNSNRVVTQSTSPNGILLTYQRDGVGRITDVISDYQGETKAVLSNRSYRADGAVTSHVLNNGIEDKRRYDLQGRLTQQQLIQQNTSLMESRDYRYDNNGNVIGVDVSSNSVPSSVSYQYDVLNRLFDEIGFDGSWLFAYDENGNRLQEIDNGATRNYEYSVESNRLEKRKSKKWELDAAGNTVSYHNGKYDLSYHQQGQLHTYVVKGQLRATYRYNVFRQRSQKTFFHKLKQGQIKAKETNYHYQYDLDGNLLAEYRNNKLFKRYVWLENELLAQVQFRSNAKVLHTTYITVDHLNTPRIGTDENGTIVWRWDSDSFGSLKPNRDPDGDGKKRNMYLRFPGQYFDVESGLHYNWNRYYDPKIGRYLTSDPIGLNGGNNTFGYVGQNPQKLIDPKGLFAVQAFHIYDGSTNYQFRFYTTFGFGCADGFLADNVSPKRWLRALGKVKDKYKPTTSGDVDLSAGNKCACRKYDPELEKMFKKEGRWNRKLTRSQAEIWLGKFQKKLTELTKDCDDCKGSNGYSWSKMLDQADNRIPNIRDIAK